MKIPLSKIKPPPKPRARLPNEPRPFRERKSKRERRQFPIREPRRVGPDEQPAISLQDRVLELEAENAELRNRIKQLEQQA